MVKLVNIEESQAVCEVLSHSRLILNLTGFWPERSHQKSTTSKIKSGVMLFLCGTISLINCVMMFASSNDFRTAIPNIFDAATMVNTILRMSWLLLRKNSILDAIGKSGRLLLIERNLEATMIMKTWYSRAAKTGIWLSGIYIFFSIVYCVVPIIHWERRLPIGVNLPSYAYDAPWFHLIYCADAIGCVLSISALFTENIFLTFFVTHLCGEFECIAGEMEKFGNVESSSFMKDTINNHVSVLTHGKEICHLMSTILYIEILSAVMIACTCGFTVLLSVNANTTAKAIGVLFICLSRVFMICVLGETISQMSFRVHEAVRNSNWYLCNKTDRIAIQLIFLQSQKPLQLRVGTFGVINLQGFGVFIFNLYSSMAVLNTVSEH